MQLSSKSLVVKYDSEMQAAVHEADQHLVPVLLYVAAKMTMKLCLSSGCQLQQAVYLHHLWPPYVIILHPSCFLLCGYRVSPAATKLTCVYDDAKLDSVPTIRCHSCY